jgi:hypothetical protein
VASEIICHFIREGWEGGRGRGEREREFENLGGRIDEYVPCNYMHLICLSGFVFQAKLVMPVYVFLTQ